MKKNIKRINLKKISLAKKLSLSFIASLLISTPILVTTVGCSSQEKYNIGNNSFSNINDAINYVKENSKISHIENEDASSNWSIKVGGEIKKFNDPKDLLLNITDQYITEKLYKSNIDPTIYENELGQINNSSEFWNNIYDVAAKASNVYQGLNDKYYDSLDEAYQSYYTQYQYYFFNGISFKDKESLKKYLIEEYLPTNNKNKLDNIITLVGPNGINSAPIDLSSEKALSSISSFISQNAIDIVTYQNSNNEIISISKDNKNEVLNKISLSDLDYIHVYSNQGKSSYVIDNESSDNNNLIGPYFYHGNLDVGSFMNKDMWKKETNVNKQVYFETKIDSMIASFFTSVINDDPSLILSEAQQKQVPPIIFRTLLLTPDNTSYDEWFINELYIRSPMLAQELIDANINLLKGKKYSTFYKIPILYSFLMSRIIQLNLGQDLINLVNDYFTEVCNFIQDCIELVFINDYLLINKNNDKKFNVVDFFEIGNPEFDLNTDMSYFLNKLKYEYPRLVAGISSYISAQNNILMLAGMIPFSSIDNSFLVEYGLLTKEELDSIYIDLKVIYDVFSQVTFSQILSYYITWSFDPKIVAIGNLPSSEWEKEFSKLTCKNSGVNKTSLLKAIGLKNGSYYTMAQSVISTEIELYFTSGVIAKNGYLEKLYSTNKNLDRLALFLDFIHDNPNYDVFRVYMAILIDKRMDTAIFNKQNLTDPYEFSKAILRLITLALGDSFLVGNAIKKVYLGESTSRTRSYDSNQSWISGPGEDTSGLDSPDNSAFIKYYMDEKYFPNVKYNMFNWDGIQDVKQEKSKNSRVIITDIDETSDSYGKEWRLGNPNALRGDFYNVLITTHTEVGAFEALFVDDLDTINWHVVENEFTEMDDWEWINNYFTNSGANPEIDENCRIVLDPFDKTKHKLNYDWGLSANSMDDIAEEILSRRDSISSGSTNYETSFDDFFFGNHDISEDIIDDYIDSLYDLTLDDDANVAPGLEEILQNNQSPTIPDDNTPSNPSDTDSISKRTEGLTPEPRISTPSPTPPPLPPRPSIPTEIPDNLPITKPLPPTPPWSPAPTPVPSPIPTPDIEVDVDSRPQTPWEPNKSPTPSNKPIYPDVKERPKKTPNKKGNWNNIFKLEMVINHFNDKWKPTHGSDSSSEGSRKYTINQEDFKERKVSKWSGSKIKFDSIKKAGSIVMDYGLEIFGTLFGGLEIAFLVFDFLKTTKTQNFYIYTNIDGTQWIWDGGLTVSKYFGFESKEVSNINDMKLIKPIQITLPSIEEYYYFNQTKFFDANDIKRSYLEYVLNGGLLPTNSKFTYSYTLFDANETFFFNASTISDLVTVVLNDLNLTVNPETYKIDFSKLNKKSEFLNSVSTSFSDGYIIPNNDNYVSIANNISFLLRPTNATILPEVDEFGNALGTLNKNFVLPGKYWNGYKVVEQNKELYENIIISDNSANNTKQGEIIDSWIEPSIFVEPNADTAINESKNRLYNEFKSRFTIPIKLVLDKEKNKDNFSKMISGERLVSLFVVNINGKEYYYVDKQKAIDFILKKLEFKKETSYEIQTIYNYLGKEFKNDQEIKEWVISIN